MMSLGDIKPASLREIETLIWKNLYLVARCQLTPEEMMNRVLDSIIEPDIFDSFYKDKARLHDFLQKKFHPIRDYTSFFFPGENLPWSFCHVLIPRCSFGRYNQTRSSPIGFLRFLRGIKQSL